MAQFTYASPAERIARVKGQMLKAATHVECLAMSGNIVPHPKNSSKTAIHRRWIPFGATTAQPNRMTVDPTTHLTAEGVTPAADTMVPQDITVTLQQYSCLYMYTDQVKELYEDDIPPEMKRHAGKRMGLVKEMLRYGVMRSGTNRFFAGGTSRATTDEKITLPFLRRMARNLMANHAEKITQVLKPSADYETRAVEAAYMVFVHTDASSDIRDLPGFTPTAKYGTMKPVHPMELGSCEEFRFIVSPELNSIPDSGAAVGATGLFSTTGTNIDVYPVLVVGEDAWADTALRGENSLSIIDLPPAQKDKNDPLGQRGYIGAKFYAAPFISNQGWMAIGEAGVTNITS